MPSLGVLSSLIAEIHDAALDPARWPHALQGTCAFVEGVDAIIQSHTVPEPDVDFHFSWGIDPAHYALYLEKYVKLSPIVPLLPATRVGEVYSAATLVDLATATATPFYKEWVEPHGYVDFVGATLDKSVGSVVQVNVSRHARQGPADDAARSRLALLVPHFRRAILIGQVIELRKVEATMLADALDRFSAGLFLVDATGRMLHANARGQAMLAQGDVVSAPRGLLSAADARADRALAAVYAAAGNGDAAVGTRGIAVSLPARDGRRYVAHVLALTSGARRQAGLSYRAAAAVFVREASLDHASSLDAVAARYDLTAGERRVLQAVIEIGGVGAVASALGLSEATVKTHLHHVFAKTGTRRQADLVKLVAAHASPFGD